MNENGTLNQIKKMFRDRNKINYLFLALATIPLVLYFYEFHGELSSDSSDWGSFGSFVGGVYGAMGFFAVAYSIYLSTVQFRIQNEDQIFYAAFDKLHEKISTSKIIIKDTNHEGYAAFKAIVEEVRELLYLQSKSLARKIICDNPESIADVHYRKIFEAVQRPALRNSFEEEKNQFINTMASLNRTQRWEYLKSYIGSQGEESSRVSQALVDTGSVNFYKVAYPLRKDCYENISNHLFSEFGEILDNYRENLIYILNIAKRSKHRDVYFSFLNAQLSKYEIILLYYMSYHHESKILRDKLKDFDIAVKITRDSCTFLMIDLPDGTDLINDFEKLCSES